MNEMVTDIHNSIPRYIFTLKALSKVVTDDILVFISFFRENKTCESSVVEQTIHMKC